MIFRTLNSTTLIIIANDRKESNSCWKQQQTAASSSSSKGGRTAISKLAVSTLNVKPANFREIGKKKLFYIDPFLPSFTFFLYLQLPLPSPPHLPSTSCILLPLLCPSLLTSSPFPFLPSTLPYPPVPVSSACGKDTSEVTVKEETNDGAYSG